MISATAPGWIDGARRSWRWMAVAMLAALAAAGLLPLVIDQATLEVGLLLGGCLVAAAGFLAGLVFGLWRAHQLGREFTDQTLALRALFDAMPVRVSIKDHHLRFVYVNAFQASFLGTSPECALGRTRSDLVADESDLAHELDEEVLRSGEAVTHFTERLAGADGDMREWLITKVPLFDRRGRVVAVGTISVDVSERNALARARDAAERRAAEVQAELATAIDSLDDGLMLIDRDRRVIAVNSVMRDLYPELAVLLVPGTPLEALAGASTQLGLFEPDGDQHAHNAAERADEFCARPLSRELALSDGRWLLVHNTPTATGGYCALRVDITRQKHIEFALQEAKEAAERANEAKSAFLANMSHELRTPLNAIIGFAEMIERGMFGPIGNARYTGYAGDIRHAGQHLLSIINDVLDLSKIEAGHFSLREGVCDVERVVGESLRVATGGRHDRTASVSTEIEPYLPMVVGDERALTQILINLLSNAFKFTPAEGHVTVRAQRGAAGGIEFEVADTGIGIAPQHIDTVLSPFGQVEGPLQRRHSGTGLGLPLARALTELHHGRLTLRSNLGQGTRVVVWLPSRRLLPELAEAPSLAREEAKPLF
jgi:PAS domain S-box-containing protein